MASKNSSDPPPRGSDRGVQSPLHVTDCTLLTRQDVAERLGRSKSWVRWREGIDIHPVKGDDGVVRFTLAEVDELAQRTKVADEDPSSAGALEARVFERLDQGASLHQLVVELRQPAKVLRAIWEEWRKSFEAGRRAERNREEENREARAVEERQKDSDRAEREFLRDMRVGDREWDRIMARARAWRTPQGAAAQQVVVARPRSGGRPQGDTR